jgi:hypothetical protein
MRTIVQFLIVSLLFVLIAAFSFQNKNAATYRDLNKNGQLDPYEDSRQPVEKRVEDLLAQMNLEEKAGSMFQWHFYQRRRHY